MTQILRRFCLIVMSAIIFISIPAFWIFHQGAWDSFSTVELRDLNVFPQLSWNKFTSASIKIFQGKLQESNKLFYGQFLNRSFQKKFENAVVDQFPTRMGFTQTARTLQRGMITITYSVLGDFATPASTVSNLLVTRDNRIIFPSPALFSDSMKKNINIRIKNYQDLIIKNPNQHFYVFYIDRIAYSKYHPSIANYQNADRGRIYQYFEQNLPEGLVFGKSMLNSFDEYEQTFFKTDHHWNIHGAWKAYEIMYQMLAQNYSEISPMLKLKGFKKIEGIDFLGSYARETLYPVQPEIFEVAEVEMLPYEIYVDHKKSKYNHSEDYLAGKFSNEPYVNHYSNYYGIGTALVEYRFQNNSTRNLMIIGSSFTRSVQMFIAAHYRNTYIIDLRANKNFSLSKAIKDYKIDDVLVIGEAPVSISDKSWVINP